MHPNHAAAGRCLICIFAQLNAGVRWGVSRVLDEAGRRSGGTLIPIECLGLPSGAVQDSVHYLQPSGMTGNRETDGWFKVI